MGGSVWISEHYAITLAEFVLRPNEQWQKSAMCSVRSGLNGEMHV